MHGLGDDLRLSDRRRIERGAAPSDIRRQTGEVDDATIATIATQVVRRAHKDAVDRTRLDAQRAKHALRIVDREVRDLKAFASFHALLADLDEIDRTGLRALLAGDAGRQVVAMKTATG